MAISSYGSGQIAPAPIQATLPTNYIDFASGSGVDWSQQYLPDLIEQESEIFGNRTISGFLSQVGAEESMTADQVIWSEQGRLHLAYTATCEDAVGGNDDASDNRFTVIKDADGNTVAAGTHGIRVGDTVLVSQAGATIRGYVSVRTASAATVTILPYNAADCDAAGLTDGLACRILVFGSEHAKGTEGKTTANKPQFKSHTNKPIIIKDLYEVSGSDASQIGWVEVSGEEGQSGYLWYLKAEGDTRARFSDYLEMTLMEAEKGDNTSVLFTMQLVV